MCSPLGQGGEREERKQESHHLPGAEGTIGGVCPAVLWRQGPGSASTTLHLLSAGDNVPWWHQGPLRRLDLQKDPTKPAPFFAQGPRGHSPRAPHSPGPGQPARGQTSEAAEGGPRAGRLLDAGSCHSRVLGPAALCANSSHTQTLRPSPGPRLCGDRPPSRLGHTQLSGRLAEQNITGKARDVPPSTASCEAQGRSACLSIMKTHNVVDGETRQGGQKPTHGRR